MFSISLEKINYPLYNQEVLYYPIVIGIQLAGRNTHHIIEATFKAFARALRQATEYDMRRQGSIPRYELAEQIFWQRTSG